MRELLHQGGPILWLILGCGLVAFVTFIERGLYLHRARIRVDDFLKGIVNILGRNNVDEALTISEETPGPVARIVRTAILHRDSSRNEIEAVLVDAGLSEVSRLELRVGVIAVVAQMAPLLGLLGTVYGMFELLGELGTSQWQQAAVIGGLRRALVTTAAGLLVAIPCYAAYQLVVGKIEALVVDMERASSEILALLTSSK